jgi:hypothetical protein
VSLWPVQIAERSICNRALRELHEAFAFTSSREHGALEEAISAARETRHHSQRRREILQLRL